MVTLRPATTADLPFLENLRRETMRRIVENHRPWNEAEQRERVLVHFDCAQIIRSGDRDVGLWKVVQRTEEILLCQVQIDPGHQKCGLGTRLIRELQAEANRLGIPITLHVYRSNPALTLYRRLGFETATEDAESLQMAYRPPQRPSMTCPASLRLPLRNHLTGRPYVLVRADAVEITAATLAQVVAICREPKVYDWLFRELFAGRPYAEANAREWLEWSRAGWVSGSHFVFVALDEAGAIAAAVDIKSPDPIAEIGYWASGQHRGIMTNAVKAMTSLAAAAGFHGLFARTKPGNQASQAVLERAGFRRGGFQSHGEDRFELPLPTRNP